MTKLCKDCKIEKNISEFWERKSRIKEQLNIGSRKGNQVKYYSYCKICTNERAKVSRKKPESRYKERERYKRWYYGPKHFQIIEKSVWKNRKYNYGISKEQYISMLESQGNVCAICKRLPRNKKGFAIDHDHHTGQIRGLLCGHCNTALGQLQDDIEIVQNAITYLQKYKNYSLDTL